MRRGLTSEFLVALMSGDHHLALLFEGQFASGALRLWSGLGSFVWGGKTWTGAGHLISIGDIEEGREVAAGGTSIYLAGVEPAHISLALGEARQNMPGKCWLALMQTRAEAGANAPATGCDWVPIGEPVLLFVGGLNVPRVPVSADKALIELQYTNRLAGLTAPAAWRYSDADQQAKFAGDRAFEYVTSSVTKIAWVR